MKTLLLTGYNDKFAPLGDLTAPRMQRYASRNDMDFLCFRAAVESGIEASWLKLEYALAYLGGIYGRVIWLDADQVITNFDSVPLAHSGFHASLDWGEDAVTPNHFSCGAFVAGSDSVPLLRRAIMKMEDSIRDGQWEQECLRELARDSNVPVTTHSRRTFNAVPKEIHPSVVEPWQPGDWCAHLTMVPLEDRIRLFAEFAKYEN